MGTRFYRDWDKYEAIVDHVRSEPLLMDYIRDMDNRLMQAEEALEAFKNVLREVM